MSLPWSDAETGRYLTRCRRVMIWAALRCGVSFDDADDVFQQASLRILARFRRQPPDTPPPVSYAIQAAKTAAYDRHLKNLAWDSGRKAAEELRREPDDGPAELCDRDRRRLFQLSAAIDKLHGMEKAVVLCRLQGMTLQQIADQYEVPKETARRAYVMALRSIRRKLLPSCNAPF